MKRMVTCLFAVIACAPLASAEPLSKGLSRISKQMSTPVKVLANPTLRVISAGQVFTPAAVKPDVSVATAAILVRTAAAPRVLNLADSNVFTGAVKPLVAYALPVEIHSLTRDSTTAQPNSIEYEPVVLVLKALRFQPATRRFEADLAVGLLNRVSPQDQSELAEAVTLLLRSDADEVSPKEVSIKRLGESHDVKISSISPPTPFKLAAATLLDAGDSVDIPIVRPVLSIDSSRSSINGLGLEKVSVQIQADNTADAKGMRVSIRTSQGEVTPDAIVLDDQGHGSTELRSDGIGTASMIVAGPPFEAGKTTVEFGKPLSSLIAALLGAIAGWVLRFQGRRKKTLWSAIVAIASAAFVCAGYSIGIRLAQWAPVATVGETLVFFVAAVGAYTGARALVPIKP